ncbi:hypothetical protein [Providencia rettgeri]|uniref:hypothetical protein n=1 Tax=Providencia rettgeri TaxID=587 RepID=UPI00384BB0A8
MPIFGKQKFDDQKYLSMPLKDMVIKIKEKPDFFEGNSHVIINKIKEIKNKGDSGWSEINDAWNVESKGKAKKKIDKYFKEGLKEYNEFLKKENINKEVVAVFNDKEFVNQPTNVEVEEQSANDNEGVKSRFCEEIKKDVKNAVMKIKNNIKGGVGVDFNKEIKCDGVNERIKKVEYNSFEDLIQELESGANLSESGVSYISFLMSYIRTREILGSEDNIRKEIDNFFVRISSSLRNIEDKKKVLLMYQNARFLSIYDAYCRRVASLIINKLENSNVPKDTIKVIRNNLSKYTNEHVDVLKLNESKYLNYIKKIKNINDEESKGTMRNIESIRRLGLINNLLSNGEFTGEKSKHLPEFVSDSGNSDIVRFFDEKINMDIEMLQSECDDKEKEEMCKRDAYIETQKQYMDMTILSIKNILTKSSVSSRTIELINKTISDRVSQENIDTFPSKLDLILKLLKLKKVNPRKIHDEIKKYFELSPEEIVSKIDDIMDSRTSFKKKIFIRFNTFKNSIMSFISRKIGFFS